jgi:hypothetical protein
LNEAAPFIQRRGTNRGEEPCIDEKNERNIGFEMGMSLQLSSHSEACWYQRKYVRFQEKEERRQEL